VYLVGEDHNPDIVDSIVADPDKLIIYQGAHNQPFTVTSDLVLPANSLLETSGLFISFDGRVQKSNVVTKGLGEAKSHVDICSMFVTSLLSNSANAVAINFFTPALLNNNFMNNSAEMFIPALKELNTPQAPFADFSAILYYTQKQRFARTPYSASVFDFHLTNTLTHASKLMGKCSLASRSNHKNFISL
jgi:NADH dehydrogenase/NADH:ubiquinone oxidoreductase subunit G